MSKLLLLTSATDDLSPSMCFFAAASSHLGCHQTFNSSKSSPSCQRLPDNFVLHHMPKGTAKPHRESQCRASIAEHVVGSSCHFVEAACSATPCSSKDFTSSPFLLDRVSCRCWDFKAAHLIFCCLVFLWTGVRGGENSRLGWAEKAAKFVSMIRIPTCQATPHIAWSALLGLGGPPLVSFLLALRWRGGGTGRKLFPRTLLQGNLFPQARRAPRVPLAERLSFRGRAGFLQLCVLFSARCTPTHSLQPAVLTVTTTRTVGEGGYRLATTCCRLFHCCPPCHHQAAHPGASNCGLLCFGFLAPLSCRTESRSWVAVALPRSWQHGLLSLSPFRHVEHQPSWRSSAALKIFLRATGHQPPLHSRVLLLPFRSSLASQACCL